jgi:hypothetical protein
VSVSVAMGVFDPVTVISRRLGARRRLLEGRACQLPSTVRVWWG